jgi:hypothetical protein
MKATLRLSFILFLFSLSVTLKGQRLYNFTYLGQQPIPRAYAIPTIGFDRLEIENKHIFTERKTGNQWNPFSYFNQDTSLSIIHAQRIHYKDELDQEYQTDDSTFLNDEGQVDSLFSTELYRYGTSNTSYIQGYKFSYTNSKLTAVNDSLYILRNGDPYIETHSRLFYYDVSTGNRIYDEDHYSSSGESGISYTYYVYDASNHVIQQLDVENNDTTLGLDLRYQNNQLTSISAFQITSSHEKLIVQVDSFTYNANNLITSHISWRSLDEPGNLDALFRDRYHYTDAHLDQIIEEIWRDQSSTWALSDRYEILYENGIAKKGYNFNWQTGNDTLFRYTFNDPFTGIKEISKTPIFNLYPNPANDILHIQSTIQSGDMTISIIAIDGREVYHEDHLPADKDVDLSSFKAGLYFVRIVSEERVYTQKLLLNK